MSSPFPGMDPYLEGYLWPDVHHRLATQISAQLMPLLRPRYVARIEVQMVADETPGTEIGIMYPDVKIVRNPRHARQPVPVPPVTSLGTVAIAERAVTVSALTPVSISIPLPQIEIRIATVEIRDAAHNQLVTSVEILSPINKREPGLTQYRQKYRRLHNADVHVLEIDLLRRGERPFAHPRAPKSAYRIALTRAHAGVVDIWALKLQDPLPIVPIPLRTPDEDVSLDLRLALATVYERAAYDLTIDYQTAPPPPALSRQEREWLKTVIAPH